MRRIPRVLRLAACVAALAGVPATWAGTAVPAGAQVTFTFHGGGYGHGVGMSQFGARGRADAGQGAHDILRSYYSGATIGLQALGAVRVKVGDAASSTFTQAGGSMYAWVDNNPITWIANPGEPVAMTSGGGTVTVARTWPVSGPSVSAAPGQTLYLGFTQGSPVAVSALGHSYRWGRFVLRSGASGVEMVIDALGMQQYLDGLGEVPSSWPTEALRAQAIAGRTYAAYRMAHPQSARFDMYATVWDQSYVGHEKEAGLSGDRWTAAVADTNGQVVTYGGAAIQAFYSSSNGGHSEASEYVWAAAVPYLRPIADPYDRATGNSNFSWTESYTGDELRLWIAAAGRGDVGSVEAVEITGAIGASGRVDKATVTVRGTSGSVTMTGNQLRSAVNARAGGSRSLLSTKFTVTSDAPPPGPSGPPGGFFDGAVMAGTSGHALVWGWAADPDAFQKPIAVLFGVDGRLAGLTMANLYRGDLAAAAPWLGPDHGFGALLPIPRGTHQICVGAINIGAGSNQVIGCRWVSRR